MIEGSEFGGPQKCGSGESGSGTLLFLKLLNCVITFCGIFYYSFSSSVRILSILLVRDEACASAGATTGVPGRSQGKYAFKGTAYRDLTRITSTVV
jgi:hypothetical protein